MRLDYTQVHRVLVDVVSASTNATPALGRYPPFKREVRMPKIQKARKIQNPTLMSSDFLYDDTLILYFVCINS